MTHRQMAQPTGFTLLEVILAIAVLGLSFVTIVNITGMSYDNAKIAASELEARLVAESVMGEVLAGAREMAAAPMAPLQTVNGVQPTYAYAIDVEPTLQPSLLLVRVRVGYVDAENEDRPLCQIVRWKIDPNYLSQVAAANTPPQ
jgi:type II secretion system protein I